MKQLSILIEIASGALFYYLTAASTVQAQITSDGTLSTNVTNIDGQNFTITDGSRAGNNLFHSFSNFSVPTGGSAIFENTADVENIISRVTGGSTSNIDGLIKASGIANLFLLNPNGIIFGSNARLNLGGSFVGTTASSIKFADDEEFSAVVPQTAPLLTVSVPIGLQFGLNPKRILVQGNGQGIRQSTQLVDTLTGLRVLPDQTLALVGGDIVLDGGTLKSVGGRIDLGSVASPSLVRLTAVDKGLALGYENVQNFGDIQLSQRAAVDASGAGSGDIQIRGKRVTLTGGSQIEASTLGSLSGGILRVTASESIELTGTSADGRTSTAIGTQVYPQATGNGGSIELNTKRLSVRDGASISTSTFGAGNAGSLAIRASDSIEVSGEGRNPSGLFAQQGRRGAAGTAGNLTLETTHLSVQNGAQISTSSIGTGNAGDLMVRATDSVELSGEGSRSVSGLFAQANPGSTAAGGNLTIETRQLNVRQGAQVTTSTFSDRNAGNLIIRAADSVEVKGKGKTDGSSLSATTGAGAAGNLTITTQHLRILDGARIAVSALGTSTAGNLTVNSDLVSLDRGTLSAATESGEGGNITLQGRKRVLLSDNSLISARAGGNGNGGNININTNILGVVGGSSIITSAVEGRGGNIRIVTQGLFVSPDSSISATSERGIDGVVEIRRPDVDPTAELIILPANVVDVSGLVAQGCPAGGGNLAAGQSQFVIAGRGGLPPTPAEATRSDTPLADLGTPIQSQEKLTSTAIPNNPTPIESVPPLVEANGWKIDSKGEVVLTASSPDTPDIPWLMPTSCHSS